MGFSSTLIDLAFVAVGGAIGCMSRYSVEHIGIFDNDKYYYTVAINITGCIIIGTIWALFQHFGVHRYWYLFAITGMLGGYTTYSAFTLDAMLLVEHKMMMRALFYISITLIGGLGGCALGLFTTQRILKFFAA